MLSARLRFHGELPHAETLAVLAGCHAFVAASAEEVLPLALLEAASRGLVPLLADLPVHREIWHHGRDCLVHPPGDAGMLAWSLRMLALDPARRQHLAAGARRVAARFRADLFCQRMDIVLAGLAP